MPSQSKPSRAIAISNHKPRKGTETGFCHFVFLLCRVLISNHKPRKGTETLAPLSHQISCLYISNHKPRKGTET